MKNKKQPKQEKEVEIPIGAERFQLVLEEKDFEKYPFLSKQTFNGVEYKVVSISPHAQGISVEFVRAS